MQRSTLSIAIIFGLALVVAQAVQSQSEQPGPRSARARPAKSKDAASTSADRSADEAAIRANIGKFVKAYNGGDAKGVAALFTPDGQIIDKDGNETEGRAGIAKTFGEAFAATPKKHLEVFVDSIRFLGSDLAVEVGSTKETAGPGEPPEYDRYTVLHVKRDGKWQMAMARDEEGPTASAHEQLRPLAWLVGDWVDDDGSSVVVSSCRWSNDGHFLLQNFKLELNGRDALDVTQRIGWDPIKKRIHSWVFDSEGGYGESDWTRDGDTWIIKATGVRPDGSTGSATNFLAPSGHDCYVWRSTDRVVGGERQPAMQVKVVRKPPEPGKSS